METNKETVRQHLDVIGKVSETVNSLGLGYEVRGFELDSGSITIKLNKPAKFKVNEAASSDRGNAGNA